MLLPLAPLPFTLPLPPPTATLGRFFGGRPRFLGRITWAAPPLRFLDPVPAREVAEDAGETGRGVADDDVNVDADEAAPVACAATGVVIVVEIGDATRWRTVAADADVVEPRGRPRVVLGVAVWEVEEEEEEEEDAGEEEEKEGDCATMYC